MMKWCKKHLTADIVVIAFVTLLLQTISFVTTYQGAKVYIGDIFPLASLFFSVAIQFCVWYFSNTLTGKRRGLKIAALAAAVCCSTWFSFTGIYNLVHSPVLYLEERYGAIREELLGQGDSGVDKIEELLQNEISGAVYEVTTEKTRLATEKERLEQCAAELEAQKTTTHSNNMRAPRQSQFETYEEYAAAYQAYVTAVNAATTTEAAGNREQVLAAYNFASLEEYELAVSETNAKLTAINEVLDISVSATELTAQITEAIAQGIMPGQDTMELLNRVFAAANQCVSDNASKYGEQFAIRLKACVTYQESTDMKSAEALMEELGMKRSTLDSSMELKAAMDTEAAEEVRRLKIFLASIEDDLVRIGGTDWGQTDTKITEVYLLPLQALLAGGITNPAYYCLLIAALVDGMTLILAVSNIERKPVWNRKWRTQPDYQELEIQIRGCMPEGADLSDYIEGFMQHFHVSEKTIYRGYLMEADETEIMEYDTLTAILCDSAHALLRNNKLYLKADIIYWFHGLRGMKRTEVEHEDH